MADTTLFRVALRCLLVPAVLVGFLLPAHAAFDFGDIICETTTTTGTGTVNLGGAVSNYATFVSQIASGSVVPYHIRASDGKLEVGYGVFTDATPDTLSRVANWSTDGSGAELTLPAGTHNVCIGPNTQMFNGFKGFQLYNDDAGAVGGVLPFWHDSASPADGDIAADIQVWGGADDEKIGSIQMEIDDGATTTEDTHWAFVTRQAGADKTARVENDGSYVVANGGASNPRVAFKSRNAANDDDETLIFLSEADIVAVGDGTNQVVLLGSVNSSFGSFLPFTDATYDLGNTSNAWRNLLLTGSIELGHDTDTTIARTAAGRASLEGAQIKLAGREKIWIPAAAMVAHAGQSADCSATYDSGDQDLTVRVCAFDTATLERASFSWHMPPSWNEGTVTFEPVWTNQAGLTTETVVFEFGCRAFSNDDALNTAIATFVTSTDTWLAQNDQHTGPESSALTIDGSPAANDYLICNVSRLVASDNLTGDALLLGINLYITTDAANDS